MTAEQQLTYLREQALSRLSEGGVEAFVLVGYLRTEGGELQRVCLADTAKNPAFEDGLRPVIHFAHMWGATPQRPTAEEPPPASEPS
jgi:hypothetical protein